MPGGAEKGRFSEQLVESSPPCSLPFPCCSVKPLVSANIAAGVVNTGHRTLDTCQTLYDSAHTAQNIHPDRSCSSVSYCADLKQTI